MGRIGDIMMSQDQILSVIVGIYFICRHSSNAPLLWPPQGVQQPQKITGRNNDIWRDTSAEQNKKCSFIVRTFI
jgi:hypothetical protein